MFPYPCWDSKWFVLLKWEPGILWAQDTTCRCVIHACLISRRYFFWYYHLSWYNVSKAVAVCKSCHWYSAFVAMNTNFQYCKKLFISLMVIRASLLTADVSYTLFDSVSFLNLAALYIVNGNDNTNLIQWRLKNMAGILHMSLSMGDISMIMSRKYFEHILRASSLKDTSFYILMLLTKNASLCLRK